MGLQIPTRVRYLVLQKKHNGDRIMVDTFARRLRKLQWVIFGFCETVDEFYEKSTMIKLDLTYAKTDDWKAGQIKAYMHTMVGSLGNHFLASAWVLEMQKRGAPHYHVLVVTDGKWPKLPDKSNQWRFGSSTTKKAYNPYYIAEYVGKKHQKDYLKFPKGARGYGVRFADEVPRAMYKNKRDKFGYKSAAGVDFVYVGSATRVRIAQKLYMQNSVKSDSE